MWNVITNGDVLCFSTHSDEGIVVTVINNSAVDTVTNVLVTFTFPAAGLTYDSDVASQGSYDSVAEEWDVGTLTPAQSETIDLCYEVTDDTELPFQVTYVVTHDDSPDVDLSNDAGERNWTGYPCSAIRACVGSDTLVEDQIVFGAADGSMDQHANLTFDDVTLAVTGTDPVLDIVGSNTATANVDSATDTILNVEGDDSATFRLLVPTVNEWYMSTVSGDTDLKFIPNVADGNVKIHDVVDSSVFNLDTATGLLTLDTYTGGNTGPGATYTRFTAAGLVVQQVGVPWTDITGAPAFTTTLYNGDSDIAGPRVLGNANDSARTLQFLFVDPGVSTSQMDWSTTDIDKQVSQTGGPQTDVEQSATRIELSYTDVDTSTSGVDMDSATDNIVVYSAGTGTDTSTLTLNEDGTLSLAGTDATANTVQFDLDPTAADPYVDFVLGGAEFRVDGAEGAAGEVLTSQGAGASPTWSAIPWQNIYTVDGSLTGARVLDNANVAARTLQFSFVDVGNFQQTTDWAPDEVHIRIQAQPSLDTTNLYLTDTDADLIINELATGGAWGMAATKGANVILTAVDGLGAGSQFQLNENGITTFVHNDPALNTIQIEINPTTADPFIDFTMGSGTPAELRIDGVAGTAGQFLTSNGAGAAPTWSTVNIVLDTTPQLGGDLDMNGNQITSPDGTDFIDIPNGLIDFQTNSNSRVDITDLGVRMGGANSRVTTILDEDDMASDSDTSLSTQQSIKAYVDSSVGALTNLYTADGTITADRTVTIDAAKYLEFDGSTSNNTVRVTGTAAASPTLYVTATDNRAIDATANNAVGVIRATNSGFGAALYGVNNAAGRGLDAETSAASTNSVLTAGRFYRKTSGTAANGIGSSIQFWTQDDAGSDVEIGSFDFSLTDVTNGSEAGYLAVELADGGGATFNTVVTFDGPTGAAGLPEYGGGTIVGTETFLASFNASGDVLETDVTNGLEFTGANEIGIADDGVTYARIQNVVANNVFLGNDNGAGSAVQELTASEARTILDIPVMKQYSLAMWDRAAGDYYMGGFYEAPATDANLTQAGTTQTLGSANISKAAHAFLVAGGAGSASGGAGAVIITVTGTSITDAGVRSAADSETIVADITTMNANDYFETTKKWIGQITYTLDVGATGHTAYAADFNYGWCKYENLNSRDFTLTDIDVEGLGTAADSGFNIDLLLHSDAGWTYHATAFSPGGTSIVDMNTDHNTEVNLANGEYFAWKRANLAQAVDGNGVEGIIIKVTTGQAGSVHHMSANIEVTLT